MEENNQKGYKLSLSGESFKGMIIQLLETLKKDQIAAFSSQNFLWKGVQGHLKYPSHIPPLLEYTKQL